MTAATAFWTAPRGAEAQAWCDRYWDSWDAPYRAVADGLIASLGDAPGVILEVGCHCGPNLRRWLMADPPLARAVIGLEANADAAAAGRHRLAALGLASRARLLHGIFPIATRGWLAGVADIAVTSYALAYVEPAALAPAIAELTRLARRAVIMVEPMGTGQALSPGWRHDYAAATRMAVRGRRWWHYAVDPPAEGMDGALVIGPPSAR